MTLEDELEIGEIGRKLLSSSRKSERPNLNKFYNDQITWAFTNINYLIV